MNIEFHYYMTYLIAAGRIFEELKRYNSPAVKKQEMKREKKELLKDLGRSIGKSSCNPDLLNINPQSDRIERYKKLASKKEYGGVELKDYNLSEWFNQVVKLDISYLKIDNSSSWQRLILDYISNKLKFLKNSYSWKLKDYQQSHWYQFQQAVKEMQVETLKYSSTIVLF